MKIKLTNVYVDDQEKALRFYTGVLGFVKKADFSLARLPHGGRGESGGAMRTGR